MARRSGGLRFQPAGGERKAQVPLGKKQVLVIERLAHDGRGIGFCDGRTWFVDGALAGERVEARVLGAHAKVVEARCERVLERANGGARPPVRMPTFAAVAICSIWRGRSAGAQAAHPRRAAAALGRSRTRTVGRAAQRAAFGYRRRARLAVRWDERAKRLEVGFRAGASQRIVPIEVCPVLVPVLEALLQPLRLTLERLQKPAVIGHVELFSGTATAVLVRHTAPLLEADRQQLLAFAEAQGVQLWLQGEGDPQPVVPARLGYRLERWDLELAWQPGDFVQVNAAINEAMIAQALDWLAPAPGERVLDLFCGLGNFSLPLARSGARVVGVEGVEAMVRRARANAEHNALSDVHFYRADLSKPLAEAAWAAEGFARVLLDPPRDGALEVVRQIGALQAGRLVYVSCNPATLARDAAELSRQGYRLTRAGVLDMFPQTAHVEAMALFERGAGVRA